MKYLKTSLFLVISLAALMVGSVVARESDQITRSFPSKRAVRIETVSGDCVIKVGSTDRITVDLNYSFSFDDNGYYRPRMEEDGDELDLSEKMRGSCEGSSEWTVTVPAGTEIRFSTASGNLDAEGLRAPISSDIASGDVRIADCKGGIRLRTASGNIVVEGCSGEVSVSTASGDIEARDLDGNIELQTSSGSVRCDNLKGGMDVGTASGDVRAMGVTVDQESSFGSASGNTIVNLASSPSAGLSVSSASGDAVLRYAGNPMKGRFELTAQSDDGSIKAPFRFDNVDEFRRHGERYIRKSTTIGADSPDILVSTGSGDAVVER